MGEKQDDKKGDTHGRKLSIVVKQVGTTYVETIIHLFKGNIGPGLFAMGDAFKNGGIGVASVLTIIIAIICVHCQHVLVNCSETIRILHGDSENKDYAETVELCFEYGPERLKSWSKSMKLTVNIFICVTQLGFCCIYFVFIATNVKQVMMANETYMDVHYVMLFALIPILMPSLITTLKYLAPVSLFANVCMILSISITMYFALKDGLPNISERKLYTTPQQLALYFGTAIFAFEGIALVLPLKNSMRNPQQFEHKFGVLNVGMVMVTFFFMFAGIVGYLKWGEKVGGSLSLNLGDTIFAQCVKIMVSLGVLFGYPLQFFVAIQIMWPILQDQFEIYKRPLLGELLFRTMLVLVTLGIAELVPALGLFISLIGALCSTALALVFPPIMEIMSARLNDNKPNCWLYTKNILILILALAGFATGTWESLYRIVTHFSDLENM